MKNQSIRLRPTDMVVCDMPFHAVSLTKRAHALIRCFNGILQGANIEPAAHYTAMSARLEQEIIPAIEAPLEAMHDRLFANTGLHGILNQIDSERRSATHHTAKKPPKLTDLLGYLQECANYDHRDTARFTKDSVVANKRAFDASKFNQSMTLPIKDASDIFAAAAKKSGHRAATHYSYQLNRGEIAAMHRLCDYISELRDVVGAYYNVTHIAPIITNLPGEDMRISASATTAEFVATQLATHEIVPDYTKGLHANLATILEQLDIDLQQVTHFNQLAQQQMAAGHSR